MCSFNSALHYCSTVCTSKENPLMHQGKLQYISCIKHYQYMHVDVLAWWVGVLMMMMIWLDQYVLMEWG